MTKWLMSAPVRPKAASASLIAGGTIYM
jgi:hypothetical protein